MSEPIRWPAERFYFALLDTRGLRHRWGSLPETQLGYLFEDVLPVPIEDVQAVYLPVGRDRVLVCAIDAERLKDDLPAGALHLSPAELPTHLQVDVDPTDLNLLTGRFAPPSVARARRRRAFAGAAFGLSIALLLVVGLERRRAHAEATAAIWQLEQEELLDRALGPAAPGIPRVQRVAALTGERRRLEWTRGRASPAQGPDDASPLLASVLERWPDVTVWVDALNVVSGAVTVRGFAKETAVANQLATTLGALDGLALEPPELRRTPDGVRFTLRLRKDAP